VAALARGLFVAACVLAAAAAPARADSSAALRDANAAAMAGDWATVSRLVDPLFAQSVAKAELAEAHRLAGLAAYAQQRPHDAEAHFLAYLRADVDATLDPALYPPDVIAFFVQVRNNHEAELRALRPAPHHYLVLNLIPPAGQLQNGDSGRAIAIGATLGAALAVNITSYLVLDSWCKPTSNGGRSGATCDASTSNHYHAATDLRAVNIAAGTLAIITYAFGVYDGVTRYRQRARERALEPYATVSSAGASLGIATTF
jgi:hypothetical protein